ncbi:putative deacetylase [Bacillus sp. TS-2]|nr:putative deacetylase [Bacillus sp. TS-2]
MPPKTVDKPYNWKRKNRRKKVKVVLQLLVISFMFVMIARSIFILSSYEALSEGEFTNTEGFISLSYFGVDRTGSTNHISNDELNRHLTLLKEQGFETISQQQIIDFYQKEKPLPEKALFLSFEDGRTDSSILTQKILEKLNYQATMFTYTQKLQTKDSKFLKPSHLKSMMKSGYWELGSNGHRLEYINIFDKEGQYYGEMEENAWSNKTLIEYYNHYLMDYLRDEYSISKETRHEMEQRIKADYESMEESYLQYFGEMPKSYAIMHANSMYNNMNSSVEAINEEMIEKLYTLHFNRDLHAFNTSEEDIYNLNRLQVAPHWPVNHLLMKMEFDSSSSFPLNFERGSEEVANMWQVENGVGEFQYQKMILTSEPNEEVNAILESPLPNTFSISLQLTGAVVGKQIVSLQSIDEETELSVILQQNKVYGYLSSKEKEQLLFEESLDEIAWNGEDYSFHKATHYDYIETQAGPRINEDDYPSTLMNNRKMTLKMDEEQLQIKIDDIPLYEGEFSSPTKGYTLSLGGEHIQQETSSEQYVDTIYDSIFEEIEMDAGEHFQYIEPTKSKTSFYQHKISQWFSKLIDFFVQEF